MARQRSHSIAFKRQVAQEFIAGETLYGLSKRHDISRQLPHLHRNKCRAHVLPNYTSRCRGLFLVLEAILGAFNVNFDMMRCNPVGDDD
jgi:hypothetical protein